MTLSGSLNADIASVGAALRSGFAWWVDELAQLVPERLRRMRQPSGPVLAFDGAHELRAVDPGGGASALAPNAKLTGARVIIPAKHLLERSITVPAMSRGDVARMLALNSERYLPIPAGSALLASWIALRDEAAGKMQLDVAALPRDKAESLARAMLDSGVEPARIRMARDGATADPRFDFLPAMREAGLVARRGQGAAGWWALAGFLFLLNIGLLIWRDSASVERLQARVDEQRPAVQAAQRIAQQMQRSDAIVRSAAVRRAGQDAITTLAMATQALPDGAWVQRYEWDGRSLRLTGYTAADVNVTAALRQMPRVASVKSAQTDTLAEIAAGKPFDLLAQLRQD